MGTHSAVAVKYRGKTKSWECTMDGYKLVETFYKWVKGLIKTGKEPFKWTPDVDIGNGILELGRVHAQEYFVGIDYDRKIVFTNLITPNLAESKKIKQVAEILCGLYKHGWRVRYGYDDDDVRGKVSKFMDFCVCYEDNDFCYDELWIKLKDEYFNDQRKFEKYLTKVADLIKVEETIANFTKNFWR